MGNGNLVKLRVGDEVSVPGSLARLFGAEAISGLPALRDRIEHSEDLSDQEVKILPDIARRHLKVPQPEAVGMILDVVTEQYQPLA